ncbi:hypothetical protein [Amycolatopsis sp. NPDC051102]|uniref:hypothetical protein n=1 Tax=Amycolatopsis sp. NPDC051102 TaxID=3155163 RepID=UPI0034150EB4
MPDPVALITADVSRTLGRFTGQPTIAQLADLSPLATVKPALVGETVQALLHRAPELSLEEPVQIAPEVALSNMSVTGGPERVAAIRRVHGPHAGPDTDAP